MKTNNLTRAIFKVTLNHHIYIFWFQWEIIFFDCVQRFLKKDENQDSSAATKWSATNVQILLKYSKENLSNMQLNYFCWFYLSFSWFKSFLLQTVLSHWILLKSVLYNLLLSGLELGIYFFFVLHIHCCFFNKWNV